MVIQDITRITWISDPHLDPDFVSGERLLKFYQELSESESEAVIITGDIAETPDLRGRLEGLVEASAPRSLFFVLGNHDYYRGWIAETRHMVNRLCARLSTPERPVSYLSSLRSPVVLGGVALIGHDGWGDGKVGSKWSTTVKLNDFTAIGDLRAAAILAGQFGLFSRLGELGEEAARHIEGQLALAVTESDHVLIATHVPPFVESAWRWDGTVSDDDWAPLFVCRSVGEVLSRFAEEYPGKTFTVLCGHTHGRGEASIRDNLRVLTAGAEYEHPRIERVLEVGSGGFIVPER